MGNILQQQPMVDLREENRWTSNNPQ
jgi:hypothetical protein